MRAIVIVLTALLATAVAAEAKSPPEVVVFGAPWCGPCRALRRFLDRAAIPYRYRNVDQKKNRRAFLEAGDGRTSIPLLVVGDQKLRGFSIRGTIRLLRQAGIKSAKEELARARAATRQYEGRSSKKNWDEELAKLRRYANDLRKRIELADAQKQKDAARDLKAALKTVQETINQLEIDAVNAQASS